MEKEMINHPAHYQKNGVECIDMMVFEFGAKVVIDFCVCNAYKYTWRAGKKEGNSKEQDLAKADWYLRKAEELLNEMN